MKRVMTPVTKNPQHDRELKVLGKVLENEEEVKKCLIIFSSNTEMLLALMANSFFNEVLFHHHDCESQPIEYNNAYLALFK